MPRSRPGLMFALILSATVLLSGCDSAEERAEAHFQSGIELLEAGDIDRALLEFRNVFKLNGQHREARQTYARVQRERGVLEESYSQYLRLVEQYPDDLEGRRALAEMALARSDWTEAERHGRAARDLAPEDLQVRAVNAALDYRQGLLDKNEAATGAAAETARTLLAQLPDNAVARRVVIDALLRARDLPAALAEIDRALERDSVNMALHETKLQVLALQSDADGMGAHLQRMVALFPENVAIRDALIVWFVQSGNADGAETFLRSQVDAMTSEKQEQALLNVVQFLRITKGSEAARVELNRLIAAGGDVAIFRSLLASIDFDDGKTAEAVAAMEAIVKDAASSSRVNGFKATLARMLEMTGNHVGARARIEEVLADDPTFVPALKMRADWLIGDDRPGEAIAELRRAMDQDPRDPEILTLMAKAHLRDGSRELAGERLAVAVEISGQRAQEALNYAQFLVQDNRLTAAEALLTDALRRAPADVAMLAALADIHLRLPDLARAEQVQRRLEQIGGDAARDAANRIRVSLLIQQQKVEEGVALLQQLSAESGSTLDVPAAVTQTYLQDGKPDRAASYLDNLLADAPQDPKLRLLRAHVDVISGKPEAAEPVLRALIDEDPANDQAVRALHGVLTDSGRGADARALLEPGLAARPDSSELLLLKALALEGEGDAVGAIAVYEQLYAQHGDNAVIANNLASLIATHLDDAESLNRAFTISRRLRGIPNPAFQDTLGWIEYRRGNFEEALVQLEPAAAGLPEDAPTLLHLGLTYVALNRIDRARETLTRAIALAADPNAAPFVDAAKVLAGLPAAAQN